MLEFPRGRLTLSSFEKGEGKEMKKIIAVVALASVMALSLVGCGGSPSSSASSNASAASQSATADADSFEGIYNEYAQKINDVVDGFTGAAEGPGAASQEAVKTVEGYVADCMKELNALYAKKPGATADLEEYGTMITTLGVEATQSILGAAGAEAAATAASAANAAADAANAAAAAATAARN